MEANSHVKEWASLLHSTKDSQVFNTTQAFTRTRTSGVLPPATPELLISPYLFESDVVSERFGYQDRAVGSLIGFHQGYIKPGQSRP